MGRMKEFVVIVVKSFLFAWLLIAVTVVVSLAALCLSLVSWWSEARRVRSQRLRRPLGTRPMVMVVHVRHLPTPDAH